MHVHLAPGESLLPGTRERLERMFAQDPLVDAVLLRLVPEGEHALARSARRYLALWDRRFLHRMNYFAPASRVAVREASAAAALVGGWRNADAAPALARVIETGRRVEALLEGGVATPVARDLGEWVRWAREEGAAWGALAARDARFAGFVPVASRGAWAKHNVWRALHRAGEVMEAMRRVDLLAVTLHATREAAWTGAAARSMTRRG